MEWWSGGKLVMPVKFGFTVGLVRSKRDFDESKTFCELSAYTNET